MQQKYVNECIRSDSENFGARIAEIGVMVAKIWRKEVVISGKWIGLNWNLFLKTRGLLENLWTTG
jgi:hypothetical protein